MQILPQVTLIKMTVITDWKCTEGYQNQVIMIVGEEL